MQQPLCSVLLLQFAIMSMWYYYPCFRVCSSGCMLFIPVRLVILSGWCVYILWAFSMTNPAFITWLGVCVLMYAIVKFFLSVQQAMCTLPHQLAVAGASLWGPNRWISNTAGLQLYSVFRRLQNVAAGVFWGRVIMQIITHFVSSSQCFTPICSFSP